MNERKRDVSRIVLWLVLLIILLAIAALLAIKPAKPAFVETAEKPARVATMKVAPVSFTDILSLPARIEPISMAEVATERAGVVTQLNVDRGAKIEKGQVLLKLDDRQWRIMAQQAEIDLREAGKEMRRWEAMKATGAVSDSSYDGIKTRYELATLALNNANLNLAKCELRSPISGTVDDRYIELGENAGEAMRVFRVINADTVKVTADVPERDVTFMTQGHELTFLVDVLPGVVFTGKVAFVATAADRMSNTFRIELQAANPLRLLRPGMIAKVSISRRMREGVVILPLGAIIPRKGDHVVFIVNKGIASRRVVKIDQITGNDAVIMSGLAEGDEVVIEGNRTLVDGMPVAMSNQKDKQ